jgi:hypothetical protein
MEYGKYIKYKKKYLNLKKQLVDKKHNKILIGGEPGKYIYDYDYEKDNEKFNISYSIDIDTNIFATDVIVDIGKYPANLTNGIPTTTKRRRLNPGSKLIAGIKDILEIIKMYSAPNITIPEKMYISPSEDNRSKYKDFKYIFKEIIKEIIKVLEKKSLEDKDNIDKIYESLFPNIISDVNKAGVPGVPDVSGTSFIPFEASSDTLYKTKADAIIEYLLEWVESE